MVRSSYVSLFKAQCYTEYAKDVHLKFQDGGFRDFLLTVLVVRDNDSDVDRVALWKLSSLAIAFRCERHLFAA